MLLPFLRRRSHHPSPFAVHLRPRSFIDARVPWVSDRGLDHAVEKEKHLVPFINVKDLLVLHPSPLPLSSIAPLSPSLSLPFPKALRFLRLFPRSFLEHFPQESPHHPHFTPSPSLLQLHDDEKLAHSSSRPDAADRLLRLLMLCPRRRLPLSLLHRLRFDLGLPRDFPTSLLPDFPDYFHLVPAPSDPSGFDLELVIYNKVLALSHMERRAMRTGGYEKGARLAFPLQYPRGFEMEKKVRKWVEEWQKLPYVSPYEDGSRLLPRSDIWEKWAVGMVHELLSLIVPKKTEKANLEMVARHVGLPSGFRKMILNHPGIFYVSNKLKTQTVVLREAYQRDLLVEKHPLMGLRYQYIHLMKKGKEGTGDEKKKKKKSNSKRGDPRAVDEYDDSDGDEEEEDGEDEDGEILDVSDGETGEDEESDDDDEEDYGVREESALQGPRRIQVESVEGWRPGSDRRQATVTRRNSSQRKNNVEQGGRGNSPRVQQHSTPRRRVST